MGRQDLYEGKPCKCLNGGCKEDGARLFQWYTEPREEIQIEKHEIPSKHKKMLLYSKDGQEQEQVVQRTVMSLDVEIFIISLSTHGLGNVLQLILCSR